MKLLRPRGTRGIINGVRILVVDDDRSVRDALRRALTLGGYEVDAAEDGKQALTRLSTSAPDALVLDIGLPEIDGLEVCRRLRGAGDRTPILMLTARDAVSDRIDGLDAGADDYLVKPFDLGELKARIRALLRRSNGGGDPDALSFAELRLDSGRHGVEVGESFVELTRTEYQLLELLMLNPRSVLTHTVIYERVWGYDFGPASNALRVYVGYLRRKLQRAGARDLIHTVRGGGFFLGGAWSCATASQGSLGSRLPWRSCSAPPSPTLRFAASCVARSTARCATVSLRLPSASMEAAAPAVPSSAGRHRLPARASASGTAGRSTRSSTATLPRSAAPPATA